MERPDKPKLLNRLSRIEGQVRGISRMVEENRYCIDVLTQLQAARAGLAKVESELLRAHLDHCVRNALTSDDPDEARSKADEVIALLGRTVR